MSRARIDDVLASAQAQGVLPADATVPQDGGRPWPVTLLVALGAWLAAWPLIGVVGLLLGDLMMRSVGPYLVGALVLAGAVVVLRSRNVGVFVEQLAVPGLLVGGGALAFGLYRDLPVQGASALLSVLALRLAVLIPRDWLRVLLGSCAASASLVALLPTQSFPIGSMLAAWLALHGLLAAWLAAMWVQERGVQAPRDAGHAAIIETVGAGALLVLLAGLAWWSGMTFLVGGAFGGGFAADVARAVANTPRHTLADQLPHAGSVLLVAVGAWRLAAAWPVLRTPLAAGVLLVALALAWLMPALGGVLLALAWTCASQRWRLATASALAAAWIIGAFYYQLAWPLTQKAGVLATCGILLAALAWRAKLGSDSNFPPPDSKTVPMQWGSDPNSFGRAKRRRKSESDPNYWMVVAGVLVLAVANVAIWQKEALISRGQKLFVELAPVDPRSLVQGDYMALNYRLPEAADREDATPMAMAKRPFVVMSRDARGVGKPLRIQRTRGSLAADEIQVELTPKSGRWILVSDAWFFREGDAQRWEAARYGEFRVTADGRALLVGLADKDLKSIPIQP